MTIDGKGKFVSSHPAFGQMSSQTKMVMVGIVAGLCSSPECVHGVPPLMPFALVANADCVYTVAVARTKNIIISAKILLTHIVYSMNAAAIKEIDHNVP